ncbi:MAG: SIMPL domain-containing protein [Anaerolineales bacterium]
MILLAAGCGLAPGQAGTGAAIATAAAAPRTLTVTGSSQINTAANVAKVQFGWWTKDTNSTVVFENAQAKRARLLVALSALNISPDDLLTGSQSVSTEQVLGADNFPTDQNLYAVNELYVLTVRDLAKLPGVLDAVRQAGGAPYIFSQQVTYELEPEAKAALLRQAQAAAVADARANAEQFAQTLGLTLVETQTVTVTAQQVVPQLALQAQVTLQVTYAVETAR